MADFTSNSGHGTLDVVAVEQSSGLFEREVLRLDDEEVDKGKLECEPTAVHELCSGQNVSCRPTDIYMHSHSTAS